MAVEILGHRVHPMLVGLPIGLLVGSVIFDLIYLATDSSRWADMAFGAAGVGVIAGLIAAPFGSLDWLSIAPHTKAKKIGLFHGLSAVVSIALFAVSWGLRYENPTDPSMLAIALSLTGALVLGIAGWLGGELVFRHGIGVKAHTQPPA